MISHQDEERYSVPCHQDEVHLQEVLRMRIVHYQDLQTYNRAKFLSEKQMQLRNGNKFKPNFKQTPTCTQVHNQQDHTIRVISSDTDISTEIDA